MSIHKHTSTAASSPRGWKHRLSLGLALLTCPCHLPLLIIALAGTTFGAWLSQYTVVVSLAMIGIFVLALLYGTGAFNRQRGGTGAKASRETERNAIEEEVWSGK